MRIADIRDSQGRGTLVVNGTGLYPQAGVEAGEVPAVGPAGARLLTGREIGRASCRERV